MNKRIKLLAASHFPRDTAGQIHATPKIVAEFAESIIQECIKTLRESQADTDWRGNWSKEYEDGILQGLDWSVDAIVDAFGVEEE